MVTTTTEDEGLITYLVKKTAKFVEKSLHGFPAMTDLKRTNTIASSNKTPGAIFCSNKSTLRALYKVRQLVLGPDEFFLGTSSNNISQVRSRLVKKSLVHNVLVAADLTEVPSCVNKGKTIDKKYKEFSRFFCGNDGTEYDSNEKVIVSLPVCLPLPREAKVQVGTIDQSTYDTLENIEEDFEPKLLTFWLMHISKWDNELQELVLQDDSYKEYRPPSNKAHSYADTPFISFETMKDDDSDLEEGINLLEDECNEVAKSRMAQSLSDDRSVGSTPSRRPSYVEKSPFTPSSGLSMDENVNDKKAQMKLYAENLNAKLYAFGVTYDDSTKKITKPSLSEFVPTFRDTSNKVTQRKAATEAMCSIEELIADQDHFLGRATDLPRFDKVSQAYIAEASFSKEPVRTLTVNSSDGVVVPMLMPDSSTTAAEKAEAAHTNDAEEALGEHETNKSKMATKFNSVNELLGMQSLIGTLANLMVWFMLYFDFSLISNGTPLPSIVHYILDIATLITSKRARKWLRESSQHKPKFMHFVLQSIISIVTAFSQASRDIMITSKIADDASNLVLRHYQSAHRVFRSTIDNLEQIFLNSIVIPENSIWTESSVRLRLKEKEDRKLENALKRKLSDANPSTPRGGDRGNDRGTDRKVQKVGDKTGYIKTDNPNMSVPGACFNANFKICKAFARDGVICSLGKDCKKFHGHITELSDPRAKAMIKAVDESNDMEFVNVDPKWLAKMRE